MNLKNVRPQNIKAMLAFPFEASLCAVLFDRAGSEYSLFGLPHVALSGIMVIAGCILGTLLPKHRQQLFFRLSLIITGLSILFLMMLPDGYPRSIAGCFANLGNGVAILLSFSFFCRNLNNTERFIGLIPFGIAMDCGFLVSRAMTSSIGTIFGIAGFTIYVAFSVFCFSLKHDISDAPAKSTEHSPKTTKGSYWFLLYAISFIAITWLTSEYFAGIGARYRPEKIIAGLVTVLIAILIQGILNRGVWHMWNITALFSIAGVAFLWIPGEWAERTGQFLLNSMMTMYMFTLFYMLAGIIKRADSDAFFRKFMLTLYIGMFASALVVGLLFSVEPSNALVLLTVLVGVIFVIISLLSPIISQSLFLPDWINSFRAADISGDEESVKNIAETEQPMYPCLDDANLSPREKEVVLLLLQGMTLRQIGPELGLTFATITTYSRTIYKKLGINSRAELFLFFGRQPEKEISEHSLTL